MGIRKRITLTISVSLVLTGIGSGAYATMQIRQMNVGSQLKYLSKSPHSYSNRPSVSNRPSSKKAVDQSNLIGTLTVPALRATLPIYEGTDDSSLKKGVGHFLGSDLPGVNDPSILYQNNVVLSGHRDSVFQHIGSLKLGDLLVVNTANGIFTYRVSKFRIVDENDLTVIVPTDTKVLTLTTCYPFIFFGHAPKRFIATADLVKTA